MKKGHLIIILLLCGFCFKGLSQSFNVRSIFNSGATVGIEYLSPSAVNDTNNFQLTKYKVEFVKVLRTKEVDLEQFNMEDSDAKANQLFLGSKFSVAKPNFSNDDLEDIYRAELELIYISASKSKGLWLHAFNVSATESQETFKTNLSPNFRAFSVYIHAKNLNFIPFIGPGISINQGKFYALPVFGFRAKLSSKLAAEFIVPVHAKLKYNLKNKVEFELATYYSAINAIYRQGSNYRGNDNTLNLQQLKSYFAVNTRLSKYYKIKVELGYAFRQEIDALSSDYVQPMQSMPFVNVSFNYNFGNSILYKFFNDPRGIKSDKN